MAANDNYDYERAGFSPFLTRSIDDRGAVNLDDMSSSAQTQSRELNYDQAPTTGSLGSFVKIGSIVLDGVSGRISIFDDSNNEVVRLGELDG